MADSVAGRAMRLAAVLASSTPSHARSSLFETRWRPELRMAVADGALSGHNSLPTHCELAVVGAGWGGVYAAWRLAIDTKTISARGVCVLEANGRVGGRVFSVRDLPHFGELAIDVGGYRFQETQRLPADLVWSALSMPTACYDYNCHGECEGPQNCYVLRDSYGNNAGYASVVERMLSEIEAAGGSVTFGATLVAVKAQGQGATAESGERAEAAAGGTPVVGSPTSLLFKEWPTSVGASRVILNLPANAIEHLDPSSVIFHDSPPQTVVALKNVTVFAMVKAYAWYDDAWWASKLGRMQGQFEAPGGSEAVMQRQFIVAQKTSEASTKPSAHGRLATPREPPPAPLLGRYHDGPLQCVVGADSAGLPVYSGDKVRFGNCSGALEVYYGEAHPYFVKLMTSPLEPLTVMTAEDGDAASRTALAQVHAALMRYHASALQAAGLDQPDPPRALVVANWVADGAFTPGIGSFGAPPHRRGVPVTPDPPGTDALRRDIRKPSAEHDVFIVNQDYGYESGWAAGSLIMAEKVLQHLGLPCPTWLNASWYQTHVADHV